VRLHFDPGYAIHMYGIGKTQAGTVRAGLAQSACGGDIRPEAILAASMKQEPTVSAAYHRSVGILFLKEEEEVKPLWTAPS
jgi:hypothetical protein